MKNLVERAALIEFKNKYDIEDINIETDKHVDLLISMHHFGYKLISTKVNTEYKNALNSIDKSHWMYMIKDMGALMTQITKSNYKILLNEIQSLQQ